MQPAEFASSVGSFSGMSGVNQVLLLGWYLHVHKGKELFTPDELRGCFRSAQFEPPDLSVYLPRMAAKKPPQVLKGKGGYRLEGSAKRKLDAKYGDALAAVAVSALLAKLPEKVPDVAEKEFLRETLDCYRIKAYRAAIVMAWSLAFDHVCGWILKDSQRLAAFNTAYNSRYPKKKPVTIRTDFEEIQESEIIDISRLAKFLPKNTTNILNEKLKRRNMAAHPSSIKFEQAQADDVITDLVNNVVVALV